MYPDQFCDPILHINIDRLSWRTARVEMQGGREHYVKSTP